MDNETKKKFIEDFEQVALTQGRLIQIKKSMESFYEDTFTEQANTKVTYGIHVCNRFVKIYSDLVDLIECIGMTKASYKGRAING